MYENIKDSDVVDQATVFAVGYLNWIYNSRDNINRNWEQAHESQLSGLEIPLSSTSFPRHISVLLDILNLVVNTGLQP